MVIIPGISAIIYMLINNIYVQVPRESLLFIIPAFGGVVSWDGDGAPFKEADPSITHQVCYLASKCSWAHKCSLAYGHLHPLAHAFSLYYCGDMF